VELKNESCGGKTFFCGTLMKKVLCKNKVLFANLHHILADLGIPAKTATPKYS